MAVAEPYGLTPEMELLVLRYCAVDAGFWRRIGQHIDPTRMAHPQAKMILGATRLHTLEAGSHPGSTVVVTQRVNRLFVQGKVKAQAVMAVSDTFDACFDLLDPATPEAVLAEVVPLVRQVMHEEAVIRAADEYARRGSMVEVIRLLETASTLGAAAASALGVDVNGSALSVFDAEIPDTLQTGIAELDIAMGGGMAVKSLGMWIGDTGGGKSIALASQVGHACRLGLHCVMATLELSREQQLARVTANHTGFETNAIMTNDAIRRKAEVFLDNSVASRGPCHIAEFDPGITTPEDILTLVLEREQVVGRKVDVVVVDYGDKLTCRNASLRDGEYEKMKKVWEGLRDGIARARNCWVWTASQPKRRSEQDRKKKIDTGDGADSQHKVRVSDVVLTLNPLVSDNFEHFEIFVAKNRGNKSRFSVGPIYGDFARGRITSNI